MNEQEEEFSELLKQNMNLLCGVLKHCGMKLHHPEFEEYLQIARISFLEAYERYPQKPITTAELSAFQGYAYQRILWKIRDTQRRSLKQQAYHVTLTEEAQTCYECQTSANFEDDLFITDFMWRLIPLLNQNELNFLVEHFVKEKNISTIARTYQVSRKTVYHWRNGVALKFLQLAEEK